MAQIEFSYNWSTNQTISCSPFEVVYSQNLISPLDLVPLLTTQFSGDAEKRTQNIKKLHAQVCYKILKQNERYWTSANKHQKHVELKEGDLVWVHLHKEHFPLENLANSSQELMTPFKFLKG